MIIATTEQNDGASDTWGDVNKFVPVSAADQLYFDVKETQWPNKGSKPNGFPWISNRAPQTYHEESKAISVSVAQHGNLGFTDMIDRNSRGYNYKEQKVEEAGQDALSGYHAPAADAEPEKIQVRTRGGDLFVEDENRARV